MSSVAPARGETVTVYGRLYDNGAPQGGLPMASVWRYKSSAPVCNDGQTNAVGVAACQRSIGSATSGYEVRVDVTINYAGRAYSVATSFTPK